MKIPIIDVEFDETNFPGKAHKVDSVAGIPIAWHKLFGKEFEVELQA